MKRCVIMPLFSIDGGSLGENAYLFADRVAGMGAEYWLMPSLGDNYVRAIDLELLRMDGLVTDTEIAAVGKDRDTTEKILRKAFARFWKPESYSEFEREHKSECADDYRLFLRYEFSSQYEALRAYALSRGVSIVQALPPDSQAVFVNR